MRDPQNIEEVVRLTPDFIGFIFYPKSKRFVKEDLDKNILAEIPSQIKKVGVFVNENFEKILEIQRTYSLDFIQLHGQESVELCGKLKKEGCKLIKVFSVDNNFDFSQLADFESVSDYFLFDTKGENYGGNGVAFDWNILKKYGSKNPFILSGGISLENLEKIREINLTFLHGIDVNSQFEVEPGLKEISKLQKLFEEVKRLKNEN